MDQPAPTIVSGLKQKENKQKQKVHKESSKDVVRGEKEIISINRQAGQHFHKLDKMAKGIVRKLGWGVGEVYPCPIFLVLYSCSQTAQ